MTAIYSIYRSRIKCKNCMVNFLSTSNSLFNSQPNQTHVAKFPPVVSLKSKTDAKIQIQHFIKSGLKNRNCNSILSGLHMARKENVELEYSDMLAGIEAAVEEKGQLSDVAFWAYDWILSKQELLPVEYYVKLLQIASSKGNAQRAFDIADDYSKLGFKLTEKMLGILVTLATRGGVTDFSSRVASYYQLYRGLVEEERAKESPQQHSSVSVFLNVATYYCRLGESAKALATLQDLTAAGHEPTAALCNNLLDAALFVCDAPVLRVLASWYANHFDVPLERGVLDRMMTAAAIAPDLELAQLAFQLIARTGYQQRASHFGALIRTCLVSGDTLGAVEALQEMQLRGLEFTHSVHPPTASEGEAQEVRSHDGLIESLRYQLASALVRSGDVVQLDALYFALADQVRTEGLPVPRLALDALVEAAGRLDLNDRAFATLQEYSSLFRVRPDTHSFNALLTSVGASRAVNMHTMFAVFEQIESSTVGAEEDANLSGTGAAATPQRPNEQSFALLLEAMVAADDMRGLPEVLGYMAEYRVRARPRAVRRLMLVAARKGDWALVEQLTALLKAQEKVDLPSHLKQRITALRQPSNAVAKSTVTSI